MSAPAVLGLDIGGTWTRALVVDTASGARLGAGRRAGGNPTTHGVQAASAHIAAAVEEALTQAGIRAEAIAGCVIGMAGASKLAGDPAAGRAITELWHDLGLRCPVEIVADVTTAFVAGTPEPDGSVLLAGTGAIAATMTDRRPTGILGGHGWLLGDEGSGYWIGRQAVRATLAALDEGTPLTGLTAAVLAEVVPAHLRAPAAAAVASATKTETATAGMSAGVDTAPSAALAATDVHDANFGLGEGRRLAAAVIASVNAQAPIRLAALVPLVLTAADQGDRDASLILHETADLLVATLARARSVHRAGDRHQAPTMTTTSTSTTAPGSGSGSSMGTGSGSGAGIDTAPIVLAGGVLAPGSVVHRLVLAAVTEDWPKAKVTAGVDGAAAAAWLAALRLQGDGPAAVALHSRLLPAAPSEPADPTAPSGLAAPIAPSGPSAPSGSNLTAV